MNCRVTLTVGLHHESSESVTCCLDFEYTFAMTALNGVGKPKIDPCRSPQFQSIFTQFSAKLKSVKYKMVFTYTAVEE